jgi:hypothetical protein
MSRRGLHGLLGLLILVGLLAIGLAFTFADQPVRTYTWTECESVTTC